VADYTPEMFNLDYEDAVPMILKYRDLESFEPNQEFHPEQSAMDISTYFIKKYGNVRGKDFQMRFLSVMQFIEHYHNDLLQQGIINSLEGSKIRVKNEFLKILLDSFRDPQPPSPFPSSPLMNQDHDFNYKKVLKAIKLKFQGTP